MIVVNLWGVPSSGKSTAAAYIFAMLKEAGINCELLTEVAKEMVWDSNMQALKNQLYIAGNQSYRLSRLNGKVDVVITDAPLLLQAVYYRLNNLPEPDMMEIILNRLNSEYKNYNYLLPMPDFAISQVGRIHDIKACEEVQEKIEYILEKFECGAKLICRDRGDYDTIVNDILRELSDNNE